MKKLNDLNYDNIPGVLDSLKILTKALIRKFYVTPASRISRLKEKNLSKYFDRKYRNIKGQVRVARILGKKVIFICGTPTHGNIGDRAISLAEYYFIKKAFKRYKVISVPSKIFSSTGRTLPEGCVDNSDIIVLHGGGNMGNVYLLEEELRRSFISKYKNNKIIIFPQTINFSNKFQNHNKELAETKKVYASHKDLTVIAREETSYEIMKEYFPDNRVLLAPDIVLSYSPPPPSRRPRYSAITLMRSDLEKTLSGDDQQRLLRYVDEKFGKDKVLHTDMQYSDSASIDEQYDIEKMSDVELVNYKLKQIGDSRLVITDRLHGMIFAALMGRMCIVFSNHDWKIKGVYDKWIKPLGLPIYFCENIEQARAVIDTIESIPTSTTRYSPRFFRSGWSQIKDSIKDEKRSGQGDSMISVLMLVYNAPLFTLQSILGVKLRTAQNNFKYELVVLDNMSRPGTRFMLRLLKALGLVDTLYLNDKNDMFSGGNNIASTIANKGSTHYLLLNSDIKITNKYWLQNMLNNHKTGITAYGVCENPARVDGYCYLIDAKLYRKYPLDESHQWWWGITKQQAAIIQKHTVLGFDNHNNYLYHYGGKSGNLEHIAQAKGMKIDIEDVERWFNGKSPEVISLED